MSQTIEEITQRVQEAGEFVPLLTSEIKKVIVGQDYLTERLILALITNEHILLEGVPGLAKPLL
jgi:MoxR-like ATPase